MRFLSPRAHGFIDYAAVLLLFLAPTLFGFGGSARTLSYVLGAAHGGMSLLTAYPLGVLRVIPFTVHAAIEFAAAVVMVVAPFALGFTGAARIFFVASGIALGLVWLVTDYRSADRLTRTLPARTPA